MANKVKNKFHLWQSDKYPCRFNSDMDIYVHVPFCRTICPFCPYLKISYDDKLAKKYLQAVENELIQLQISTVGSIYVGGGTPTLVRELFPLLGKIKRKKEFAVEVMPGHLDYELADFLADCSVNYVSIGIQSMNDKVLQYLKRPNTSAENKTSIKIALDTFECVDVDLIFDVVNFDIEIALSDFQYCIDAGVGQISTYPLMRFGFTPFGKSKHNNKLEHYVLNQMEQIAVKAGYHRKSVWTFTRGNNHYSSITRSQYFGIGAGAASYAGNVFWVNTFNVNKYIDRLLADKSAVEVYTPMKGYRKILYEKFWQVYNGQTDSIPWFLYGLLFTGHIRKDSNSFLLTRKGYESYHNIERWVTYHYIEPLWETMYSLASSDDC